MWEGRRAERVLSVKPSAAGWLRGVWRASLSLSMQAAPVRVSCCSQRLAQLCLDTSSLKPAAQACSVLCCGTQVPPPGLAARPLAGRSLPTPRLVPFALPSADGVRVEQLATSCWSQDLGEGRTGGRAIRQACPPLRAPSSARPPSGHCLSSIQDTLLSQLTPRPPRRRVWPGFCSFVPSL